ncbi:MAG TPA: hypothetical protein VKC60_09940 [Opitutaceae bacterium]|nr:hypothetical protein [Opitutaceae bacterium]
MATLLSGCIFAAVQTARLVDRQVNPPQPMLHGSIGFFANSVSGTAQLRPIEKRWRGPIGSLIAQTSDSQKTADSVNDRMVLWATLTNNTPESTEVTVLSIDSPLGKAVPKEKTVALAPGQKVVLDPMRSAHEKNFDSFEVTVTLKRGDVVETQKIMLAPEKKKKATDVAQSDCTRL